MALDAQAPVNGMTFLFALELASAFGIGLALGAVHFGTLSLVSRAYVDGRAGRAAALQLGRLALLGLVLFALSRLGAWPLLLGAGGVMVSRAVVLRRTGRRASDRETPDREAPDHASMGGERV